MTDAQDEITALTDSLADVWAELGSWKARALAAEEQVEQAREILHELFTNASIDGRNNWAPVEAFLRAYPVASASGSPDTEPTG